MVGDILLQGRFQFSDFWGQKESDRRTGKEIPNTRDGDEHIQEFLGKLF